MIEWISYVANAQQTANTLTEILSTLTINPIVFAIVSVLVLIPYEIDKKLFTNIMEDLSKKKQSEGNN